MKLLTRISIVGILALLVGFTIVKTEVNEITEPVMNTSTVAEEESLVETSAISYVDKGYMTASWYGPRFHGRKTANGEIYDQMAFTAAHKGLKFGTLLKITNPKNDQFVIVRINDRGPYIGGRQLDLSRAAALQLGMMKRGVLKVKVDELSLKGVNFPVITLN
ncbi:MAG TPA: septal ring lytic transglycosylase RlpA family protein [Ignavibacteriaceae bacterium]